MYKKNSIFNFPKLLVYLEKEQSVHSSSCAYENKDLKADHLDLSKANLHSCLATELDDLYRFVRSSLERIDSRQLD